MEQKLMSQVPAGSSFQYTPPHRSRPLKFLVLKQYVGFSWVKKAGERTGEKIKVQRTKVRYIGSYTETKDDTGSQTVTTRTTTNAPLTRQESM